MTQDQPRDVRLTDKHIVFGVMAASVVAVLSFLCGVFVGRGVLDVRPVPTDSSTVSASVDPDPTPASDAELPAPSAAGTGGAESLPPGNLTYADRLNGNNPPSESIPAAASTGPPPSPAADDLAVQEPPVPVPTPAAAAPASPQAASTPAPGQFSVQVAAVRSRVEAQSIVDRLVKKGYPAFVFVPPGSDRTGGFRVRVGSFKSRAEAGPTATRLQKEEQLKPWITR